MKMGSNVEEVTHVWDTTGYVYDMMVRLAAVVRGRRFR